MPVSPPSTNAPAPRFNNVLTIRAPSGNIRSFSPTHNIKLVKARRQGGHAEPNPFEALGELFCMDNQAENNGH